ncbi:2567_t:CDS:1, partial [Cetraspora pellucida]
KKFVGESNSLCCNNEKIVLSDEETPPALLDLFVRTDKIGCEFRNNIRAYNALFAFTSMGVHLDQQLAN